MGLGVVVQPEQRVANPVKPSATNGAHQHHWNTFATTVALLRPNGVSVCSGVLVGPRHILTAAHCLCDGKAISRIAFGDRVAETDEKNLRFSLPVTGQPFWRNQAFCTGRDAWLVDRTLPYPEGDIAVLKLGAGLPGNARDLFLPVETIWTVQPHETGRIAGFGYSRDDNATGKKNHAHVEILPDGCADPHSRCHAGLELLARPPDGKGSNDSCSGDSGAPLFVAHDGLHYLAGIVSRGTPLNPDGFCGKGGIYVDLRAEATRQWLSNAIQ